MRCCSLNTQEEQHGQGPGADELHAACVCHRRKNGKTKCQNTFSGYECVCGPGFISHVDENGKERCLNMNECVSTEAGDLDPRCTCERCACLDTYGSYECARALLCILFLLLPSLHLGRLLQRGTWAPSRAWRPLHACHSYQA